MNSDGEVVGILSETDLISELRINERVADIMTREVITVNADNSMSKAIRLFHSYGMRCLLVVDSNARLIGVLGRKDILIHYAKVMDAFNTVESR